MKLKAGIIRASLISVALYAGACSSVHKNLEKQETAAVALYTETLELHASKQIRALDWDSAYRLMLSENLDIKKKENSLVEARESRAQLFRDMLPGVRFSANLSKALGELGTISDEDLRMSVFSTVYIPGLVNFRARHYAATLAIIRAEWALDLIKREKVARLREVFVEYESLILRRESAARIKQLKTARHKSLYEQLLAPPESLRSEQEAMSLMLEENRLQESLSKLIGEFGLHYKLDTKELPELRYEELPLNLNDTKNVAVLLRKNLAADLEALRLRVLNSKLNFFPDLRLGISTPPLYQKRGKRSTPFSAEDIRLSFSSSVSLDTQGRLRHNLKSVKRQVAIQNEVIREQLYASIQRALLAQREMALLSKELRLTEARLIALKKQSSPSSMDDFRVKIEQHQILTEQITRLKLKKAKLEGGFLIMDDGYWREQQF